MREYTVRARIGARNFKMLEELVKGVLPASFKEFMIKYSGLGLIEDYYTDSLGEGWIVAAYDSSSSMYGLTKEFIENGWGNKLPFAYDEGGWHYCLSFDDATYGKIIVNRWTDYDPSDQFLVIADSFDCFIDNLEKRPPEYE